MSALRNAYHFQKPDSWLKLRCRLWSLEVGPTLLLLPPEENLNTPLQAVAARVTLNKVVTFCSIYLPPSDHVANTDLINLTEQLPSPFVLLGDFNCHSPVWGNESYNSRRQMLEDLFSEMDFMYSEWWFIDLYSPRHRFHFRTGSLHLWPISGPRLWVEYTWRSVWKWPLPCNPNHQRCWRGSYT